MTSKLRAAALLVLVGAAFAGGRALAGIPSSDTLHYSGTLEKASGEPLTGDHFIELKLWHEASGGATSADCATKSEKYPLISGHFSVPLPAACVDAISRYSDMFVELIVDGAPLGRAKLGAVPYAVESEHATKADSAKTAEAPAGGLKTALEKSDSRVAALESAVTPAGVLDRFNAASAEGMPVQLGPITWQMQHDIGWALQHSAAAAACAAASPERDSSQHHIVLTKPGGSTCTQACATNGSPFAACRTSIAIGQISLTKATAYTDVVATNYNYGCEDSQQQYDEVLSEGFPAFYTAYCCCYQER